MHNPRSNLATLGALALGLTLATAASVHSPDPAARPPAAAGQENRGLRLPKLATARVVEADAFAQTCRIDRGTDHGLAIGDVFVIRHGLAAAWQLTLTEVQQASAGGTVVVVHRNDSLGIPAFPGPSWLATLEPASTTPPPRRVQPPQRETAGTNSARLPQFGLFLPREDVSSGTREVDERIARFLAGAPAAIPLAREPIVALDDVVRYDWRTHTLVLRRPIWSALRPPPMRGAPFVVVADGEPIYVGAFFSLYSSFSCATPVIRFDDRRTNVALVIERAYPAPWAGLPEPDPRADPRVKNALQAAGRLQE